MACHVARSLVAIIELKNILYVMVVASLHRFQFGLLILFDGGEGLFVENLVHLGHDRLLASILSLDPDSTTVVVWQGLGGLFSLH